jgi:hypothetical protein
MQSVAFRGFEFVVKSHDKEASNAVELRRKSIDKETCHA